MTQQEVALLWLTIMVIMYTTENLNWSWSVCHADDRD
jgi:hypothetical protein